MTRAPFIAKMSDASISMGFEIEKTTVLRTFPSGLIKATKVDGVYDSDPIVNPEAVRFDHLTYIEAINRRLEVMDSTALSLCMDNRMPLLVLNLWQQDALRKALFGEPVGTLISE